MLKKKKKKEGWGWRRESVCFNPAELEGRQPGTATWDGDPQNRLARKG